MHADVCIFGGGLAGAATARVLAIRGHAVALCWSPELPRPHFGEVLVPAARRVLRALSLDAGFLDKHPPCLGTVSLWGSDHVHELDLIRDADGHAWRVDRTQLEADLRNAAVAAGAMVIETRASLRAVEREGDRWLVRIHDSKGTLVHSRWLVDATGRRARTARRLGAQLHREPALVAVAARVSSRDGDMRSIVESVPYGWWYRARLSAQDHVAALFTDPEEVARRRLRNPVAFAAALSETQLVGRGSEDLSNVPVVTSAAGRLAWPVIGQGWLAVGDAALSFDPLSSQGMFAALYGGWIAADAIAREFDGESGAALAYASRIRTIAVAYAQQRADLYALEQRWPCEPFWRRRQGAVRSAMMPEERGEGDASDVGAAV